MSRNGPPRRDTADRPGSAGTRTWVAAALLLTLLALPCPVAADLLSDAWEGAKGAWKGVTSLDPTFFELADVIEGKGCSFKLLSAQDFGDVHGVYKFAGSCSYQEGTTKTKVIQGQQHKTWITTFTLNVQALWSQEGKLASEIVEARKDGKLAFGVQVSYGCAMNPWKSGQSCPKTHCTSGTTKGCEGLDTVLSRAAYQSQPLTRQVGAVVEQFFKVKITSPKDGATVSDNKALDITIALPYGQKVQYELTSPAGPAYSQILGPVQGWGKPGELTFVLGKVPSSVLKPPGKWTLTAHLIGVEVAPLTKQQVAFQVKAATYVKPDTSPQTALPGGKVPGPGGPGGGGQARGQTESPTLSGPIAARSTPAGPPKLELLRAQQQGASDLLVVLRNPQGSAENPAQSLELRLGSRAVGRGRVPKLAGGGEERLVVHVALPPGTRGPVELEVWVGSERLGSARMTPTARTP